MRNISETSEDSDPRKFEADELTSGGRTGACSRHLGDAAKRGEGPSEPDRALSPSVAKRAAETASSSSAIEGV